MFYLKVFITIFGFISVLVTPLIGLANSKQPPVTKQSESVELKSKVDQISFDLQQINAPVQAGTTFSDYATQVTRLNLTYINLKNDLEFRQLGGTLWLAMAIESHVDALNYWKQLLAPSSTSPHPFIQKHEEILQGFTIKFRQDAWETSARDFTMFFAIRGLSPEVTSLNGHCKEKPKSNFCK
jgi:hypothetical protein